MTTTQSAAATEPRRLAVLGGGLGALSAVFELTSTPGWQRDYDITIYQLGWRLGGKGASGRNQDPLYAQRIEEHGVHVFFGFYANAFNLMKRSYGELGRPPGSLLASWSDAFKGHDNIVLEERLPDGRWFHWDFQAPVKAGEPGSDGPSPDLWDHLEDFFGAIDAVWETFASPGEVAPAAGRGLLGRVAARIALRAGASGSGDAGTVHGEVRRLVDRARALAPGARKPGTSRAATGNGDIPDWLEDLGDDADDHTLAGVLENLAGEAILGTIVALLWAALRLLWLAYGDAIRAADSDDARRLRLAWIILNYAYGNLRGAWRDDLIAHGIESINHRDYREWVCGHAFDDGGITRDSALIRWLYDAVFAYREGDLAHPSLEAGTGFLTMLRLMLTYQGHFTYKMQAGMGDVVFVPLYEVLRRRGVKFRFFHRVTALRVADDRRRVVAVEIERQASLTPSAAGGYEPLVEVVESDGRSLPCWPAEPRWDQLDRGAELKRRLEEQGHTLESYAPPPFGARMLTLAAGRDYDLLLLGISLGALRHVCADLVADAASPWQNLVDRVGTVRTQACQLWLNRPLAALVGDPRSPLARPAILCAYDYDPAPIDSYADMHQVLARETWPAADWAPRDIAYFCSFMRDLPGDHVAADCADGAAEVHASALAMIEHRLGPLWPAVHDPDFDWNVLVDPRPTPGQGRERFEAQFWIGIANPSDRYVASFAGSSAWRLWASHTGYDNLVVTGDWTRTTFNLGCAEATTMSGLAAANAIRGRPLGEGIVGWGLFTREDGPPA